MPAKDKKQSDTVATVFPADPAEADNIARAQREEAQEAKLKEIAKRKVFVKGCQSCENFAAGHADHLTCGHDKKS